MKNPTAFSFKFQENPIPVTFNKYKFTLWVSGLATANQYLHINVTELLRGDNSKQKSCIVTKIVESKHRRDVAEFLVLTSSS